MTDAPCAEYPVALCWKRDPELAEFRQAKSGTACRHIYREARPNECSEKNRARLRQESFQPTLLGAIVHPDYIIRRADYSAPSGNWRHPFQAAFLTLAAVQSHTNRYFYRRPNILAWIWKSPDTITATAKSTYSTMERYCHSWIASLTRFYLSRYSSMCLGFRIFYERSTVSLRIAVIC